MDHMEWRWMMRVGKRLYLFSLIWRLTHRWTKKAATGKQGVGRPIMNQNRALNFLCYPDINNNKPQ
jgi:hypothetical protein